MEKMKKKNFLIPGDYAVIFILVKSLYVSDVSCLSIEISFLLVLKLYCLLKCKQDLRFKPILNNNIRITLFISTQR